MDIIPKDALKTRLFTGSITIPFKKFY